MLYSGAIDVNSALVSLLFPLMLRPGHAVVTSQITRNYSSSPCRHLAGPSLRESRSEKTRDFFAPANNPRVHRNMHLTKQRKFRCASIADGSVHFPRVHFDSQANTTSLHLPPFPSGHTRIAPREKMDRVICVRDRKGKKGLLSGLLSQCIERNCVCALDTTTEIGRTNIKVWKMLSK